MFLAERPAVWPFSVSVCHADHFYKGRVKRAHTGTVEGDVHRNSGKLEGKAPHTRCHEAQTPLSSLRYQCFDSSLRQGMKRRGPIYRGSRLRFQVAAGLSDTQASPLGRAHQCPTEPADQVGYMRILSPLETADLFRLYSTSLFRV